jgi:hypothetical protein
MAPLDIWNTADYAAKRRILEIGAWQVSEIRTARRERQGNFHREPAVQFVL